MHNGYYFPDYITYLSYNRPDCRGVGYIRKHPNLEKVLREVRDNIQQLQRAEARILEEAESRQLRRKEILGEFGMSVFNDPDRRHEVSNSLDGYLTDKNDRLLFNLKPTRTIVSVSADLTAIELQTSPSLPESGENGSYEQICSSDDPICIPSEGQSAA